jgi:nitrous oxidase accessory protein
MRRSSALWALCCGLWVTTQSRELMAQSRTIEVRPQGATPIADAVRRARPGDRLLIARGIYREPTVIIDRKLTIVGEPGAVIDGGLATHILRIEADSITLRGLELRNVGVSHVEDRAAIRVGEVRGCRIEDNRLTETFFGIYLAGSTGCVVARNEIHATPRAEDNSGNGIHLWTARGIRIVDNRVSGHRDGIYLEFAHDAVVAGNLSEGNVRYGLHFMYADDCRYERNVFRKNQAGVAVMYTRRVAMTGNRFEDNWGPSSYGLLLKEIYDSELTGNTFARNTTGLFADGATRMQARQNVFTDNGWAVKLMASTQDAELSGNTFLRNTFDVSTNSRSGNARVLGNFWDEYQGYDLDRDGRGDVAHRPVRLFSLVVERNEPTLVLLRSPLVAILDRAERVLPSLTPETLQDSAPLMRRPR